MLTTIPGNIGSCTVVAVSWTPTEVATITAPAQSVTVPGVKAGDCIEVTPPSFVDGVGIAGAIATADNTVSVKFVNPTASGVTPASGTYKFKVTRHEGVAAATKVIV